MMHMNCMFQLYAVDEVLTKYVKGTIHGPSLVHKLRDGNVMTRAERIFFVKVLGKYLMKAALRCETDIIELFQL